MLEPGIQAWMQREGRGKDVLGHTTPGNKRAMHAARRLIAGRLVTEP